MSSERYSIILESYKGTPMSAVVYGDDGPWTGTLEEAGVELAAWITRNPGGVYKIIRAENAIEAANVPKDT